MSTVTASPGTTVTRHRLTRTLPRATASAGALAAAAATAGAAVLRGGGVPLAVHGKIPLAAFAQLTFLAAVGGGVLVAVLIRRGSAARQRFIRIAAGLTALSCAAPAASGSSKRPASTPPWNGPAKRPRPAGKLSKFAPPKDDQPAQ